MSVDARGLRSCSRLSDTNVQAAVIDRIFYLLIHKMLQNIFLRLSRAETGETEAVAVIDTNILIRQCLEALDVVCGGQFTEYKRNLLEYVHRLEGKYYFSHVECLSLPTQ